MTATRAKAVVFSPVTDQKTAGLAIPRGYNATMTPLAAALVHAPRRCGERKHGSARAPFANAPLSSTFWCAHPPDEPRMYGGSPMQNGRVRRRAYSERGNCAITRQAQQAINH
jgi:hypothetical protein